jgi:membrane protease YdiL (CAAX protease family)
MRMSTTDWVWRPPPGWPEPPPGWAPPPGWKPSPEWPPPPQGWQYWVNADSERVRLRPQPLTRQGLVLETWFVELAFLVPGVLAAVDLLAQHVGGVANITRFPTIVSGHPLENLILGVINYLEVGAVVPLALLLLSRTGQRPAGFGLTRPWASRDLWPGIGLAGAGIGVSFLASFLLLPLERSSLFNNIPIGHVPHYYVVYGIAISATTAITEETLVSGYLLTRLEQLGWDPRWALVLSLILRTSYHVYYGLGFLLTIPTGYLFTRSFQKHRRLARPIIAHFLYDAILITISVLIS